MVNISKGLSTVFNYYSWLWLVIAGYTIIIHN